jgi:exopolysaccharide biosynthesis polyprenyl glycosylphosphotransferase
MTATAIEATTTIDPTARTASAAATASAASAASVVAARSARAAQAASEAWRAEQAASRQRGADLAGRGSVIATFGLDLAAFLVAGLVARTASLPWQLAVFAMVAAAFAIARLYRPRLALSLLDDLPALLAGIGVATSATVTAAVLAGRPELARGLVGTALALAAAVGVVRGLGYHAIRKVRARRALARPTLVLGTDDVGRRLGKVFGEHPEYGLRVVGYLDAGRPPDQPLSAPLLGDLCGLNRAVRENDVRAVVVAFPDSDDDDLVEAVRTGERLGCEVLMAPRLAELHAPGRVETAWGMPLVRRERPAIRRPAWKLKRALDLVCASAALVVLGPAMLVTALAVRMETGPGVLFRQERVGLGGRCFTVFKFRSLRPSDDQESQTRWSIEGDPRIGPVGRFIRRTGVDELPQLLNVLRGDMSMVGPRPERPFFVERFRQTYPAYMARHRVAAGMTGLAAVNGLRGDTSVEERLHFDNAYAESWSFWLDVRIMLRTVATVFRGQ